MNRLATILNGARHACLGVALLAGATLVGPALDAQVLRGVVRDSATARVLSASAVLITSARDSTPACSVFTHDDGRFRCAIVAGSAIAVTIRRVGYAPVQFAMDAMAAGDSVDLAIALIPAVVILDPVHTTDTSYKHGLFWVTPGRAQFERHMELGKGHFISGVDVQRSEMRLSDYLIAHFPDSLKLVDNDIRMVPVVPVANNKFLTSTINSQCLYMRIDRLGIREAIAAGAYGDNIDDILAPHDVVGVELYLDYHDVPADWRMDAFPTGLVRLKRQTAPLSYTVGNIGLGSVGAGGSPIRIGGRVGGRIASGGGGGGGGGMVPTCPFLQIWTRMAW